MTGGKDAHMTVVNTLISGKANEPGKATFYRYPNNTATKQGLPSILDRFPDAVATDATLGRLSLVKTRDISDTNVTLETMLLLQYFRFIGKGVSRNTPDRKWFFRKGEIYYAWSQPLDLLPATFPVPGKGSKKWRS